MNGCKTFAFVAIAAIYTMMSFAENASYSDQDVKADIEYYCSLCHPQGFGSLVERAFAKSGSDNDRFSRILGEFAIENYGLKNGLASRWAIDKIAQYGTTNSLPFLYSCATNPVCGDCAIKSIIAIEGVTSNSIAAVMAYNSSTNSSGRKIVQVFEALVDRGCQAESSIDQRTMSLDYALSFARTYDKYTHWMDDVICRNDPTYRNSKRRLSTLRSEFSLGLDHWEIGFVTNAINELVAYPEAELPD